MVYNAPTLLLPRPVESPTTNEAFLTKIYLFLLSIHIAAVVLYAEDWWHAHACAESDGTPSRHFVAAEGSDHVSTHKSMYSSCTAN